MEELHNRLSEMEHNEVQTRDLMQQVQVLLDEGHLESALNLFHQLHPSDQSKVLVELDREHRQNLLISLPPTDAAIIMEHLEVRDALVLAMDLKIPSLSNILDETSPDVAADILRRLPSEHTAGTLETMSTALEVIPLLKYPDDSAGGLMTPDFPMVKDNVTAANALDLLRLLGERAEDINSTFVVDRQNNLKGSLSVIRLALARPGSLVRDLMNPEVVSVTAETDQEECARVMARYDLTQLPVLDKTSRLIGVILVEDVVDVVEEEATEDMYRMAGIEGERLFGPLNHSVRRRLPWLCVNLSTAFLAAGIIAVFESTISKVVALAIFLPVIGGQGGVGGTQTFTLLVRSIAVGEMPVGRNIRILQREVFLGLIHGLLLGLIVGIVAYLWKGNFVLGIVVGVAMLGNMVVAGFVGAAVPLLLRRLRIDPAVASATFVTTFTDVLGFLLFLGLGAALIDNLL